MNLASSLNPFNLIILAYPVKHSENFICIVFSKLSIYRINYSEGVVF